MKDLIIFTSFLVVALTAPNTKLQRRLQPRIIGGEDVNQGEYPFVVTVQEGFNDYYLDICAGILIEKDLVLTAAVCIVENDLIVHHVGAGSVNLTAIENDGQYRTVIKTIFHPNFNNSGSNDLVLLKVDPAFELNDNIQLAKLPEQGASVSGDAVVTAWGATESNGNAPIFPIIAQKADLSILSDEVCEERLDSVEIPYDPETNLCTEGNATVCILDMGSPLIQNDVVIGLGSGIVYPCPTEDVINIFTQISSYVDWINGNLIN